MGDYLIYFLFCTCEDPVTQRRNYLLKVLQLVKAQDSAYCSDFLKWLLLTVFPLRICFEHLCANGTMSLSMMP